MILIYIIPVVHVAPFLLETLSFPLIIKQRLKYNP